MTGVYYSEYLSSNFPVEINVAIDRHKVGSVTVEQLVEEVIQYYKSIVPPRAPSIPCNLCGRMIEIEE